MYMYRNFPNVLIVVVSWQRHSTPLTYQFMWELKITWERNIVFVALVKRSHLLFFGFCCVSSPLWECTPEFSCLISVGGYDMIWFTQTVNSDRWEKWKDEGKLDGITRRHIFMFELGLSYKFKSIFTSRNYAICWMSCICLVWNAADSLVCLMADKSDSFKLSM